MSDEPARIVFELPRYQWHALQAHAAKEGTTITALLLGFVNSLPLEAQPRVDACVEVERDGDWWLVKLPGVGTVGQARHREDAEQVAGEAARLWLGIPADATEVRFIE